MPTVLETAKDATYAAVGLQVLMLDEVAERTAESRKQIEARTDETRKQVEAQLDLARDHGRKAQARLTDAMPVDLDKAADRIKAAIPGTDLADQFQATVQPMVKRSFELAEPAWKRIADMTPGPFDAMVLDGVERMRGLLIEEAPVKEAAPATKPAARKPAAKKTAARKPAAKKTTARKPAARKAAAKKS